MERRLPFPCPEHPGQTDVTHLVNLGMGWLSPLTPGAQVTLLSHRALHCHWYILLACKYSFYLGTEGQQGSIWGVVASVDRGHKAAHSTAPKQCPLSQLQALITLLVWEGGPGEVLRTRWDHFWGNTLFPQLWDTAVWLGEAGISKPSS